MAKVFITGGAGFIGRAVARKFKEEGYDVVIFDILEPKEKIGQYVRGTIMYTDEMLKAMKGCDYVVHLAAMLGVKLTEDNMLGCLDVNILGTKNVLDAAVKAGVKKIVIASSSEVYGEPLKNPISESDPVVPKSVYGVSKLAGEEYVKAYHQEFGIDYSIIRFFNAYGPGQRPQWVLSRFVHAVVKGESPTVNGDGTQERCFCHVNDSALGVFLATTKNEANGEIFNIGNSETRMTMKELADEVIKASGKDIKPIFVELKNADRNDEREIFVRYADTSKAERILGFKAKVGLPEGIRDVIEKDRDFILSN